MDKKLLVNPKFLEEVRQAALMHRDDAVPERDPALYQPMMWSKGVIEVLIKYGYKIEKKKD